MTIGLWIAWGFTALAALIALGLEVIWYIARQPEPPAYIVVPHEKTEWGDFFAVIDRRLPNKPLKLDRYTQAQSYCAMLNNGDDYYTESPTR